MSQVRQNTFVGLFVLCALACLGALILMFGQDPTWLLARDDFTLVARFPHAAGIRTGTPVAVGGIRVGHVVSVGFHDPQRLDAGVRVVLAFDRHWPLPVGTRAVSSEPGLGTGRPPIELVPARGTSAQLESGSEIDGEIRAFLDSVLPAEQREVLQRTATEIGDAAAALTPVLRNIEQMTAARTPASVDSGEAPGNLASAVQRLDNTLRHFDSVLGDPNVQSQLRATVENAYTISEDAKTALGDIQGFAADARQLAADGRQTLSKLDTAIVNLDERLDRVAREFLAALDEGGRLLAQLNTLVARTSAGEGSLGKVLTDDRLYEALVLTFERLATTVEEMRLLIKDWQEGKIRVAF